LVIFSLRVIGRSVFVEQKVKRGL